MVDTTKPGDADWASDVEAPLVLDNVDNFKWDDSADLVIAGAGGAGVAAALEALHGGASVLALDRYEGGGSTTANGGVFYAGGGTRIQKEAGVEDSPDEMFRYLQLETGGVISDKTLRHFCDSSAESIEWLLAHGAKLSAKGVFREKVSYPPLKYHLYHSDNSLIASYAAQAKPAARGHRTDVSNGAKAWGLGSGIWQPLFASALKAGMRFEKYTEVRQLVVDSQGRVVGVKALSIPASSEHAKRFARYLRTASALLDLIPPVLPIAALTIGLARRYLMAAGRIEHTHRVTRFIRARQGVLLSAGGFILNSAMVKHYAPLYQHGLPNGTLGDTGSGIRLGQSAGGDPGCMDRITTWCNINPPLAWTQGIVVNQQGERFCHEGVYGSTLGDAVIRSPDGKAWLIFDKRLRSQALKQIGPGAEIVRYQRQVALLNLLFNTRKANTIEALADKLGIAAPGLVATLNRYNSAARGEQPDELGKLPKEISALTQAPYYAVNISVGTRLFPMPMLTLGGLRVDEESGLVKNAEGHTIPSLYAAGRSALGICSNVYMSGLAFADCIYSGRRAGRHAAQSDPHR